VGSGTGDMRSTTVHDVHACVLTLCETVNIENIAIASKIFFKLINPSPFKKNKVKFHVILFLFLAKKEAWRLIMVE